MAAGVLGPSLPRESWLLLELDGVDGELVPLNVPFAPAAAVPVGTITVPPAEVDDGAPPVAIKVGMPPAEIAAGSPVTGESPPGSLQTQAIHSLASFISEGTSVQAPSRQLARVLPAAARTSGAAHAHLMSSTAQCVAVIAALQQDI